MSKIEGFIGAYTQDWQALTPTMQKGEKYAPTTEGTPIENEFSDSPTKSYGKRRIPRDGT